MSPDEDTDEQLSSICEAVLESGVDGVIVRYVRHHLSCGIWLISF